MISDRTLHEAYQFLSWKYSKIRDIMARNPELKERSTSEGDSGGAKEKFKMVGIEEEEDEVDVVPHNSRPSSASGSSGSSKRIRRTKSAKGSFAGRGGQIPKPIETINEADLEGSF